MKILSFREHKIRYMDRRTHLSKCSANVVKNFQLARSNAFAMVDHYLKMEKLDFDQLQRDLKTRFPGGEPFDKMVKEDFAGYIAIGEDPYDLFDAVRKGLTRAQFLRSVVLPNLIRAGKRTAAAPTVIPDAPATNLPLEDQLRIERARIEAMRLELKRLHDVERENAQLHKRIKRIETLLKAHPIG